MLYLIMLFWIGKTLAAPTWFWVIWALSVGWKLANSVVAIFNAGKESKDKEG